MIKNPLKVLIAFLFLIILLFGFFSLFKQFIGDVRPAILPPSSQNQQSNSTTKDSNFNTGSPLQINLSYPQGFQMGTFANNISGARDLQFTPLGTLLVSSPGMGTIKALPDKNNDGNTDEVKDVITGLDNPHGLAFYEGKLFIAEEKRVARYSFDENSLTATLEKVLFSLQSNNNHNKRSIVFDRDGKMFVSVGSTCNVCNEKNKLSGTVIVSDKDGKTPQVYGDGLRNAPFLTLHPDKNEIWITEMGRDFLGDNLPPDEINILSQAHYGWPYCYGNKVYDSNFGQRNAGFCSTTVTPVFEIPAHSAPLGLTFITSNQFPADWQGDLLVAYHGSWNRSVTTGYKIVRMNVEGNKITEASDFITNFIVGSEAKGRPVDMIFDSNGNLYISDDRAGAVYKMSASK